VLLLLFAVSGAQSAFLAALVPVLAAIQPKASPALQSMLMRAIVHLASAAPPVSKQISIDSPSLVCSFWSNL
jgi:hypothetical protein